MNGTITQSRQSKIRRSKRNFFVFVSAALVACIVFFNTGLPVFASETLPDPNLGPVNMTAGTASIAGHLTPYQVVDNYGMVYDLTTNNNIYELDTVPNSGYITVIYKGLISVRNEWSGLSSAQLMSTIFGITDIRTKVEVGNLGITSTLERVSVEDLNVLGNYNYLSSASLYNATSTAFEILDKGHFYGEYVSDNPRITYNATVFASYRIPCTESTLQSVLAQAGALTVTVSTSSTRWNLSMFYGEENTLEMLDAINTRLYDIYRYDVNTYGAVVSALSKIDLVNTNLSTVHTLLGTISGNILAFKQQAHTDSQAIYDLIYNYIHNDPSASSAASEYEEMQSSFEAQESEANVAVESAIPSAENELAELESYSGVVDLATTHASAISFWQQVGEYILDPVNLGAASTALIIASLLAFIVFLLRL